MRTVNICGSLYGNPMCNCMACRLARLAKTLREVEDAMTHCLQTLQAVEIPPDAYCRGYRDGAVMVAQKAKQMVRGAK